MKEPQADCQRAEFVEANNSECSAETLAERDPKITAQQNSSASNKVSSFPHIDEVKSLTETEKANLEARLSIESREIIKKFHSLLTVFRQSLCDCNSDVTVSTLRWYLKQLPAYKPVNEVPHEQQKSVFEEHMQQIKEAKSIEDLFNVIVEYCSFFNYDLIKCMIEEFGSAKDKEKLKQYEEEFKQYAKRRVYECPSNISVGVSQDSCAKLHMKLDSRYDVYSLKGLQEFQFSTLSDILKVSPHVLLLCKLDKGCIELTFQTPFFVQEKVFPLSTYQENILSEIGILSLSADNYYFQKQEVS